MSPHSIPRFGGENEGNYSLVRKTKTGENYTTAHVSIYVAFKPTKQTSSSLIPIAIVALLITIIIIALVVIFPLLYLVFVKKTKIFSSINTNGLFMKLRSQDKKLSLSIPMGREGCSGYVNLADLQSPTKEYIDNVADYTTIDETSLVPLETDTNIHANKGQCYSNLTNSTSDENYYEKIKEGREYCEMNPSQPYERYIPMSTVKEGKIFVAKYIPAKDFPATYQHYLTSGMGNESLFSVEFKALSEESKKNIESECEEARKEKNMNKNPIKNLLPYDENRVVLDSPYLDSNYINASYISEYQFIASIHPTGDTLQDFLQMIYQTEASMVIMLTTRKEKAKMIGGMSTRVCYWPKKDEPLKCHPYEARLTSSNETTAFVKQEISLKNTLEEKDHLFSHCLSPIWNEDGTIIELNFAVSLLSRVLKQKQDNPFNPIIIHCEDGISKTGIFLTVINVIKELNVRKSINIFNVVKNLRKQRMHMVPTMVSCSSITII